MAVDKSLLENFHKLLNKAVMEEEDGKYLLHHLLKKSFITLASENPKEAKEILDDFEGQIEYNNFLSEEEAKYIISEMVFDSGKKGESPWDPSRLFRDMEEYENEECEEIDSEELISSQHCYCEVEPYYNKWALFVTMNKYYADNYNALKKWVEDNGRVPDIERACYDFAVEQLMDKDKARWVRWYFGLSK